MTPEQWQRLQDLFEEVIQEPLDQRQSILDRLEAGIHDPSLRIELRRLVEHAEVDAEFLRPVAGLGVYSEAALKTGDVVADRFEILNSIGKGGMAEVFEAFDRKLKERVAIKIIAPEFARDPALLQRFHQEVQIARRITHANVCRIHDLGEHRGQPYLSMELLEGETLSKRLERGPLPLDAWSDLADQLFQGLGAAHAAGVIHRDLKPSNLILVGSVLKILDFGLARPVLTSEDDGLTRPGTLIGTLDWMAPEQLLGEYDERSDLYSAALILVRALQQGTEAKGSGGLTGALRRATTDTEFRRQIPKSVPASWRFALLSCLERDPRERPRTVEDVQKLARSPHVLTRRLTNAVGSHWKTLAIVLGILALLGVSIRSLWYPSQSQPLRLKPGSVIMIAPTDNATRESQFDGMTSVLQADFNQSSRFNVWDSQRLSQVLGRMRLDPHTKPDVRQWHEIAVREQAPLIVFSTLSKLGDSYKFSIQCEQLGSSPDSSVAKWEETETASGPSELFEAVHRAIKRVRERAGEDATEIAAHSRLPQDITSSKWQTLELFQQAQSLSYEQRLDEAASLLRRAVQLDPNFAMGWMRLGDILNSQDKWEEGFANWRQAIALAAAQHLSEHEGLNIESRYALEIRDFKNAESALRAWTLKFPNDPLAAQLLASCLLQMGNYDESVRLARDNQQRFPVGPFGTSVLIRGLMARKEFGDIDQQITLLEKLSGKPVALGFRAMVVASRGDSDGAAALLRDAVGSSDVMESSRATTLLANLEADRGRFEIARQLLSDGILKDSNAGQDGFGAAKTIALAFLDGMDGKRALALARARQAVSIRRSPLVIVQAVTILARNGAVHDAAKLMDTYPSEEGPRYAADRLRMRGEVLAAQGRFQPALEVLERAAQMDRPQEPKEYYARALDLAGDHMQAKLVYQQIVNASFLTWIVEDQWPATRLLAKQYLKKSEGRVN